MKVPTNQKYTYLGIGICVLIILLFGFYQVRRFNNKEVEPVMELVNEIPVSEEKSNYVVDIKGAVVNPGVYELEEGSFVLQVIDKAGGLLENANTSVINLSKRITDTMIIIVYTNEEIEASLKSNPEKIYVEVEIPCECPDSMNEACVNDYEIDSNKDNKVEETNKPSTSMISINEATKEELLTLSGIGESKADAIIKYRKENGKFITLEDLMKVSGIGESVFEKINTQITL